MASGPVPGFLLLFVSVGESPILLLEHSCVAGLLHRRPGLVLVAVKPGRVNRTMWTDPKRSFGFGRSASQVGLTRGSESPRWTVSFMWGWVRRASVARRLRL